MLGMGLISNLVAIAWTLDCEVRQNPAANCLLDLSLGILGKLWFLLPAVARHNHGEDIRVLRSHQVACGYSKLTPFRPPRKDVHPLRGAHGACCHPVYSFLIIRPTAQIIPAVPSGPAGASNAASRDRGAARSRAARPRRGAAQQSAWGRPDPGRTRRRWPYAARTAAPIFEPSPWLL